MNFSTQVSVPKLGLQIQPCERILFVGSCFADNIGARFADEAFPVTVNPYGVMYNPVSIGHTVERTDFDGRVVFLTLGTNHVYILKETGQVVDNCNKRPHNLFDEVVLDVEQCAESLTQVVKTLTSRRHDVRIVLTVSPIRYAKYGFHGSALSKAVLLLAADRMQRAFPGNVDYFPAYEIVNDELRDYRFYAPDMIHPSQQAVDYIWMRLVDSAFSDAAVKYLDEWAPLKAALGHKPFDPEGDEYKKFRAETLRRVEELEVKYPGMSAEKF